MAQIEVASKELTSKAQYLQQLSSKFKTQIESLSSVEGTLTGMWDGSAKEAFHTAFTTDLEKLNTFKTTVDEYVTALNSIAGQYEKAEQRNTDTATQRNY